MATILELFFELMKIFDDSVVDNDDALINICVWMCVFLSDASVCCPAGVSDGDV